MTECEVLVMQVIWRSEKELDLPAIVTLVNERFGKMWAPQTVSTFLKRLKDKGYLEMHRIGRTFLYKPLVQQKDYVWKVVDQLTSLWFEDDTEALIEYLKNRK